MANSITLDASAIAEQLQDCEPGEELVVTLTVDSVKGPLITGSATAVEYGEAPEEEEPEKPMPRKPATAGKRMPKAMEKAYGS